MDKKAGTYSSVSWIVYKIFTLIEETRFYSW